eukprot:6183746-Pleurochrysis_carterae.AAC.1
MEMLTCEQQHARTQVVGADTVSIEQETEAVANTGYRQRLRRSLLHELDVEELGINRSAIRSVRYASNIRSQSERQPKQCGLGLCASGGGKEGVERLAGGLGPFDQQRAERCPMCTPADAHTAARMLRSLALARDGCCIEHCEARSS